MALIAHSACATPSRPTEEASPPAPSPSPVLGCTVPPGVFNENCSMTQPTFYGDVDRAIEDLLATSPEMFNLGRARGCPRCFLVVDPDRFTQELVARLESTGLCAFYDGEELGVKSSNDFNDQFDVLTFEMFLRRENGSYRTTCRPAWF
jgi:hypothetical protein